MSEINVNNAGPLFGRLFVGGVYAVNGVGLIGAFGPVSQLMQGKGVPFPSVLLATTIAAWLIGGAMLIFGIRTRIVGLLLAAITIPVTLYMHGFWTAPAVDFQNELNHFLKNTAIIGALIYIAMVDDSWRTRSS